MYDIISGSMKLYIIVLCDMIWYDMIWYDMICDVMTHNADNDTVLKYLHSTQLLCLFQDGETVLHHAITHDKADTVKVLLEAGADLDAKNVVSTRMYSHVYI